MSDRIVCTCMDTTESEIIEAIKGGADTVDKIGDELQAGAVCGSCVPEIEELIAEHK